MVRPGRDLGNVNDTGHQPREGVGSSTDRGGVGCPESPGEKSLEREWTDQVHREEREGQGGIVIVDVMRGDPSFKVLLSLEQIDQTVSRTVPT